MRILARAFPRAALAICAALLFDPTARAAAGKKAAVAAGTPEAARAGISILRAGGNAIDAAAAAAFTQMVADPAMCSLGGRSQALIYLNEGKLVGLDGATISPGSVDEPARTGQGYKTCAVPGSPAALEQMVVRHGKLPLRIVLQPAIQVARNGFVVNDYYQRYFQSAHKSFRLYPGSARHFLKSDGTPYAQGETFKQPALAAALEIIADEGAGAVYRGRIAQAIVHDMAAHGGLIRADDLARYRVLPGTLVEGSYRGRRIVGRGDQCDGASVIEMLQILEHFPLASLKPSDASYLHLVAQAQYLGYADEELADWKQVSKALAARRIREIDPNHALPVPARPQQPVEEGETTHLSVVDELGNAVALTLSIGPTFGTKVANPEYGFIYAYSYRMNDGPLPYQREKTSQSPTIVLEGDKPLLAIGSAGSARITASILQVIVNVLDHKMDLDEALAAPRVFLSEAGLRIEDPGYGGATLERLAELGYQVVPSKPPDSFFGRVQAIRIDPRSREIRSSFDPRGYGSAEAY